MHLLMNQPEYACLGRKTKRGTGDQAMISSVVDFGALFEVFGMMASFYSF